MELLFVMLFAMLLLWVMHAQEEVYLDHQHAPLSVVTESQLLRSNVMTLIRQI